MIDSRAVEPGDLFVGLPGEHVDGGAFAAAALDAGAWGVLVAPQWARSVGRAAARCSPPTTRSPALGALARGWRRDARRALVIGVTGSVGKTSTKDLIAALIAPHRRGRRHRARTSTPRSGCRWRSSRAPAGTEVLVLEMAMRGFGQIAELAAIAEPDVGVITNIGPVHLEQIGLAGGRRARRRRELLDGLRAGGTAVVPADEPLLEP